MHLQVRIQCKFFSQFLLMHLGDLEKQMLHFLVSGLNVK